MKSLSKIVVLVTKPEFEKGRNVYKSFSSNTIRFIPTAEDEEALAEEIKHHKAKAVIIGPEKYVQKLHEALPHGGIIARFGVGYDGIDRVKASNRGILVVNTPGVLTVSVAEHAIWLMGCLARHIFSLDAAVKDNKWSLQTGRELRSKTLGITGFGKIGREVARMASAGLKMRILVFDRIKRKEMLSMLKLSWRELKEHFGIVNYTNKAEEVLAKADIISNHLSAEKGNCYYFNQRRFDMMKGGSLFLNTARGSMVDEEALFDSLIQKKLGGAALDVFEQEPYKPKNKKKDLRILPNVILTPHIGSNTKEANERMAKRTVENVLLALKRHWNKLDLVNPEVLRILDH